MALFGPGRHFEGRMVALCAEPGMGRKDVITGVLSLASQYGAQVCRRGFSGSTPEAACRYLTRKAREISNGDAPVVLGFDDIPPSDELCVLRQARALHRMWSSGVSVIFSIVPEARQLLEQLPECRVISSAALLEQEVLGRAECDESIRFTRGIPSLARTMVTERPRVNDGRDGGGVLLTPSYYDALGDLMGLSVRSGLPDEERRLRLCMLLLGRGSTADLTRVLDNVPLDVLEDVRRNAPLFGVAQDLSQFRCVSDVAPNAAIVCQRSLMAASALFPEVVVGCLSLLVDKGEFDGAALVARFPECDGAPQLILDHAAEFIDRGETGLVRHALSSSEVRGTEQAREVGAVVSAMAERGRHSGAWRVSEQKEGKADALLLLLDTRRLLRGEPLLTSSGVTASGELERRLVAHVGACSLMLRGAFTAALSMLAGGPEQTARAGMSNALLVLDRELAQFLSGGTFAAGEGGDLWPQSYLTGRPLEGVEGYLTIHRLVGALASGDGGVVAESERAAARSERAGDRVVQTVALIVGALADLGRGLAGQARIRSSMAMSVARSFGGTYLERVADLVEAVASFVAGDRVRPRIVDASRDDLDAVSSLVLESIASEEDPLLLAALPSQVPWDALWLLDVLCSASDELSKGVIERAPQGWRRALRPKGARHAKESRKVVERSRTRAGDGDAPRSQAPIEVRLLGGFSISVRGRRIPDLELERRSIKSMIEFLLLSGGSAKRYQLVEQVWPDCDYATGFSRAYQTTSALRASIAEIDKDISLITVNRTSGEISVDMGLVSCDVDEFIRSARAAVDSDDDAETLSHARAAERLYGGDLYVPPADATGRIATIGEELRALYADAMVEGSAAALRLGHERTASRMASNALLANDLREDAVTVLIRALRACGRSVEADRQHRAYEARVARAASRAAPARSARPDVRASEGRMAASGGRQMRARVERG